MSRLSGCRARRQGGRSGEPHLPPHTNACSTPRMLLMQQLEPNAPQPVRRPPLNTHLVAALPVKLSVRHIGSHIAHAEAHTLVQRRLLGRQLGGGVCVCTERTGAAAVLCCHMQRALGRHAGQAQGRCLLRAHLLRAKLQCSMQGRAAPVSMMKRPKSSARVARPRASVTGTATLGASSS